MTARLVQLSGVIVDHIYWVEAVPRAGEEAIVRRAVLCAGGGYNAMVAAGIRFIREPKQAEYGTVAVFEDLYGNLWDLVQPSKRIH